jgi:hypothetical protein
LDRAMSIGTLGNPSMFPNLNLNLSTDFNY